jgi:hypothetical protein
VLLGRLRLIGRTLEEHPGLTAPELADRVGYGRRHMSLLLLRLEEHGHVAHHGRRWFPGTRDGQLSGTDGPPRGARRPPRNAGRPPKASGAPADRLQNGRLQEILH